MKHAWIAVSLLCAVASRAGADDTRARVNYMLHCQGCHLPDARGFEGKVPVMKDFVGYFAHSGEGREYLIRVPGVAGSALSDADVAELMNWLLQAFSANEMPEEFTPYSAPEVGRLRASPERDPARARARILNGIAKVVPEPAAMDGE